MMNNRGDDLTYVLFICIIGGIFGLITYGIGLEYKEREWKQKCIEMGVAKHDAESGKWKLKPEFRKKLNDEEK